MAARAPYETLPEESCPRCAQYSLIFMSNPFLQAEWRKLAIANYSIGPDVLQKYVPNKTELDLWNGICYVSLVGFMFQNTRVKGIRVPFHVNFEEVNLRFYVRYKSGHEWKRGVVFIKEIVPKPALALVANIIYKEHYETMPMRHSWEKGNDELVVEYRWRKNQWNSLKVVTSLDSVEISDGSEEEFITEHYWGYTKLNGGRTSEYGVEHPKWNVYRTLHYSIDVDFGAVYGDDFAFLRNEEPRSVFLAEGSDIVVQSGGIL